MQNINLRLPNNSKSTTPVCKSPTPLIGEQTDRLVEQFFQTYESPGVTSIDAKETRGMMESPNDSLVAWLTQDTVTPIKDSKYRSPKHSRKSSLNSITDSSFNQQLKEIIAEKNRQIQSLKAQTAKLSKALQMSNQEMAELKRVNDRLRAGTKTAIEQYRAVEDSSKETVPVALQGEVETLARALLSNVNTTPIFSELLYKRDLTKTMLEDKIRKRDMDGLLVVTMNLLNDIAKQLNPPTSLPDLPTPQPDKQPVMDDNYLDMMQESERLLATISSHSKTINALNKQIAKTMKSSQSMLKPGDDLEKYLAPERQERWTQEVRPLPTEEMEAMAETPTPFRKKPIATWRCENTH